MQNSPSNPTLQSLSSAREGDPPGLAPVNCPSAPARLLPQSPVSRLLLAWSLPNPHPLRTEHSGPPTPFCWPTLSHILTLLSALSLSRLDTRCPVGCCSPSPSLFPLVSPRAVNQTHPSNPSLSNCQSSIDSSNFHLHSNRFSFILWLVVVICNTFSPRRSPFIRPPLRSKRVARTAIDALDTC